MALEIFGSIIKEEILKTFELGTLPNTLVLENLGLFPGYYGAELPLNQLPDSLFFVMTKKESAEKIMRLSEKVKKQSGLEFDATIAKICIQNSTDYAIRVRGIEKHEQIGELQTFFKDSGIEFAKSKSIESEGLIQIKKIFTVSDLTDEIFKDDNRNMYYLKLKHQLNWGQFKAITEQVRNNVSISAFDVALGVFYASKIHDLVRVYSKTMKIDELETLHAKYNELIEKSI